MILDAIRYGLIRFVAMLVAVWAFQSAYAAPQDTVLLTESTIAWSTVKYETKPDNSFVDGSLDLRTIVDRTFKTYVLENRYLKVTLVPEFGGRIISMIYKPTGHEQLYRTQVGMPYGMKAGNFYYDWLMVYGGIFPTFPDPEHGKTWLKPWDFKIVKQTAEEVTVAMSFTDDFSYADAPKQFNKGATGIQATYYVTLKAGRAALDTRLVLKNPNDKAVDYEYWTCTALAPGSDPNDIETTGAAEIIAPIDAYTTPHWSANIAAADESLGDGRNRFDKLHFFRNWPSMGIAYAAPDMQGGNFWGVINHDNEEGIIRIADNKVTRGLKMWTWGFPSFTNQGDARKEPNEAQPYVELWAGVSDQFFHNANLPAQGEVTVSETYSPTIAMNGVTQANDRVLVNLVALASGVHLQFFSTEPGTPLRVTLKRGATVLFDGAATTDPVGGSRIFAQLPAGSSGDRVQLSIAAADGKQLIAAETTIK